MQWIKDYVQKQIDLLKSIDTNQIDLLIKKIKQKHIFGGRIYVIGNGGSAANASHFANDLGKGASDSLRLTGQKRFCVQSLCDNVSWITALANDYDYSEIFVKQLENHAVSRDVLIGISVSGTSPNLLKAFQWAKQKEMYTVSLISNKNPAAITMESLSDICIKLSGQHYGRVEDAEMMILHLICYYFMENPDVA